jgi:hypothetical protein
VGSACTLTRAKIEGNIPRKRGAAAAGYDKAITSFYDKVWGLQECVHVPLCVWAVHAQGMVVCAFVPFLHPTPCAVSVDGAARLQPHTQSAGATSANEWCVPAALPARQVFSAVVRHVDWDIVRCLVIAGPGFTKDQFREHLDKGGAFGSGAADSLAACCRYTAASCLVACVSSSCTAPAVLLLFSHLAKLVPLLQQQAQ